MVVAFIGTLVVCIALLLVTLGSHFLDGVAMYIAGLFSCAALGVLNAIMQTAIIGLAGTMSQEMSAACMLGLGISGLVSLVLSLVVQAVTKVIGVNEEMSGLYVTIAAFALCFFYTMASVVVYRLLCRDVPAVVEAIGRLERRRSTVQVDPVRIERGGTSLIENGESNAGKAQGGPLPSESRGSETASKPEDGSTSHRELAAPAHIIEEESKLQRTLDVLREVAPQALNVWLVFAATMMIFPGVCLEWAPLKGSLFLDNKQLFGTLLIGCFQVFDVVGRGLVGCCLKCIAPARLWIFIVLRCIYVPLFILGQRQPQWFVLWGSDEGRFFPHADNGHDEWVARHSCHDVRS